MGTGNVYRIAILKSCQKAIAKAPYSVQAAVSETLKRLTTSPYYGSNIKPLRGELEGFYRCRIGSYRLIYRVDESIITVVAVAFGSRGDIYK